MSKSQQVLGRVRQQQRRTHRLYPAVAMSTFMDAWSSNDVTHAANVDSGRHPDSIGDGARNQNMVALRGSLHRRIRWKVRSRFLPGFLRVEVNSEAALPHDKSDVSVGSFS